LLDFSVLKGDFAMKGKRFSVEQIVAVLKQVELGLPVADAIRHVGISEQTFYLYGRLSPCK
jgi:putative transposase